MGGEEGKGSFGSDNVMVVGINDEDVAFRLFQEWFIEHEEVQKIWSCGSTLGQDGPEVGARNERTEAVSESALQQSMAPSTWVRRSWVWRRFGVRIHWTNEGRKQKEGRRKKRKEDEGRREEGGY